MKRHAAILLLLLTGALFAAYDVVGFSLYRSGENSVAEITTDGPTKIRTATLKSPDRLIIDLEGGVHRLSGSGYPALPPGIVVEFRSAQFKPMPDPVTRIVLVLAEPVDEVRVEDGPRSGRVFIPTPGYPDFEKWSVGRETPAEKPEEPAPEPETEDASEKQAEPGDKPEEEPAPPEESPREDSADEEESDVASTYILSETDSVKLGEDGAAYVRPVVDYDDKDNRDPFIVAKAAFELTLGSEAVPVVDDLRLVGIVQGEDDNPLAVLQDDRGWGFILGVGDTVESGEVAAISDSTVQIDITEFGMTRTVNIDLPKEATQK